MSKKYTHIHKYKKVKWGDKGTIIWRCMLPGCTHYKTEAMIENSRSLCWQCGKPFEMTKDRLRPVKPKCPGCINRKDAVEIKLDELLKGL